MSIKSYTDIIIDGDQFSIKQLSAKEKENKYHAGLALITLDRIEEVMHRGLTYLATAEDIYSKMSPVELRQELKQLAKSIKAGYLEMSQHLSYARRFFGGVAQEEEGIRSAYERIEKLAAQGPVLDLPNELIGHICSFLEMRNLGKLAQVNAHANAHAEVAKAVMQARECGYKGHDSAGAGAKNYLKYQQSFETLVKDGMINEDDIVRRKGYVNSKATLSWIKQFTKGLSEAEQAAIKVKLNDALLHYSSRGNAAVCQVLLQLGADSESRNNFMMLTALEWARPLGNQDVIRVLSTPIEEIS
jgi:hypothetical protein